MTSRNTTLDDFSLSDDWLNYTCQQCGVKFHASKSAKRKYCSDECARSASKGVKHTQEHIQNRMFEFHKKTKPTCECFICGKSIKRRQSMIDRSDKHFCSRKCYGVYMSETRSGENNPQYGKPSPFKDKTMSIESRMKLSASRMGQHNSPETEFTSEQMKKLWKDPEFRNKTIKGSLKAAHISPNKIEQRIAYIISKHNLPFKFVGDGKVVIYGLCPDFVSTDGSKKIIEVFGDIFHDPEKAVYRKIDWKCQEFGRSFIFSQHGYDTLIIWENEIRSSTNDELYLKINEFIK